MTNTKELKAQIKLLRAENKSLKNQGFSFFQRTPEQSVIADDLRQRKVPYFVKVNALSVAKETAEPCISLIEGDNLGVLTALQYSHKETVDVIYIDPPYNTGKDVYTYSDTYNFSRVKRDSQMYFNRHSSWLSFMEVRLVLARELLNETGVIMCAISTDEYAHLKLLMDSIFGEENFIANITWSGSVKNNARYVSASSDYMLIYTKNLKSLNDHKLKWRASKPSAQSLLQIASNIWQEANNSAVATRELRKFFKTDEAKEIFAAEPGLKMYNSIDSKGNLYRAGDLSSPSGKGGQYDVINPEINKVVSVPSRGWAYSEATFQSKILSDEILWNGESIPAYKRYLLDSTSIVLKDVIQRDRDASNKLLQKMIGRGKFSYPKDHFVLAEWIDYVLPDFRKKDKENPPIIMDFFAGSGSTGHAVAYLNSHDNGNRQCILVTNNENEIAENVTAPRIKAAITGEWFDGKHTTLRGSMNYYRMKLSHVRVEPKRPWDFIPYSEEYINSTKELLSQLKSKELL